MEHRTRPIIRRSIAIFAAVGVAILVIAFLLADVVPKGAITPSAIDETSYRIGLYYFQNKHHLPPDMAALPVREGYDNRTTDAWNRPLLYSVDSADSFTLRSLGRDGVPGGTGEDADVICKFRVTGGEVQRLP